MPKKYEAIRNKFMDKGLSAKEAKTKAAKIYNATRSPGQKPITGRHSSDDKKFINRAKGKR